MRIILERADAGSPWIAQLEDVPIFASGNTPTEAVEGLLDVMESQCELLHATPLNALGPMMREKLVGLRKLFAEVSHANA